MAASKVIQGAPADAPNPRARALARRISALDPERPPEDGRLEALALGLVDALLEADRDTLRVAFERLREVRARAIAPSGETAGPEAAHLLGWLAAMIALSQWSLERLSAGSAGAGLGDGTQAHRFLELLRGSPQLGSAELQRLLATDETQVSRTGRRLLEGGLVSRQKAGRQVFWRLSPRGRQALEPSVTSSRSPTVGDRPSFWMEAIRRGFEGAAGDEPSATRRAVDPTRERIIETTVELHNKRGIQATTWQEIAAHAGVPMETLEAHFPTPDDLYKSCGQHILADLRLPPPPQATVVFEGSASEQERIRRLVTTLFGAYERQGTSLEVGRRERGEVPLVDESISEVDAVLDALAIEAVRPRRPDPASIASIRALTDVSVWRTLRDRGLSPEEAVDEASAALERWLQISPVPA